jgi:hypothetical protein
MRGIWLRRSPSSWALTLSGRRFDVVLTDMERVGDHIAGLKFVDLMDDSHASRTIYYIAALDPSRGAPAPAFAITNRPDAVMHYVIDLCGRAEFS